MGIRFATVADLPATVDLHTRAYGHSPLTRFIRPHRDEFIGDVEKSALLFHQVLLSSETMILEVLEVGERDGEGGGDGGGGLLSGKKGIVGFAAWRLAKGQERGCPTVPVRSCNFNDRSADRYLGTMCNAFTDAVSDKFFKDHMELYAIAVDPQCQRAGVGTRLVRHGMEKARRDKVSIGVVGIFPGTHLYESLGFATKFKVTLADPRPGTTGKLEMWAQEWVVPADEDLPE